MTYEIVENIRPALPLAGGRSKCAERETMERLPVGGGFWIKEASRVQAARDARPKLKPKRFTVTKVPQTGWQVRRTA